MPKKKPQYYAVSCGRQIGIYSSWELAQEQVIRYPCAAYKGYTTFNEALQVMKMNGYHNPPVFSHHDVDVRVSASDSHLSLPVHAVDQLPTENTEVKQILVIDHPELNDEHLLSYSHMSSSDTHLLNFRDTEPIGNERLDQSSHKLNNRVTETEIDSDETICKTASHTSSLHSPHVNSEMNHENNVRNEDNKSTKEKSNLPHCTHTQLDLNSCLNEMFLKLEDKIEMLGLKLKDQTSQNEKLHTQIHEKLERIVSDQNVVNDKVMSSLVKLQNDQTLIQSQQVKHMEDLKLCMEKSQTHSSYSNDRINETLSTLTCNSEKIESNLNNLAKDLNRQILDIHETMQSAHMKFDDLNINELSTNCKMQLETSDMMITSINKKLDELKLVTHLQTTSMPNTSSDNVTGIVKMPSLSPNQITNGIKVNDSEYSPSPSYSQQDDDRSGTDSDGQELLYHHPAFGEKDNLLSMGGKSNRQGNNNQKSLRIPTSCRNALLGDSNLKMVDRTRLDNTKSTEVRTYRGASVKKLQEYVASSEREYPHVQKVLLSVGSVDCSRRYIDEETFICDYADLLSSVEKTFPSASIGIVSIPPHGNPQATEFISRINSALKKLARQRNVTFCYSESLWMHVGPRGDVDGGILAGDNIHLTLRGVGLFLRPITKFFFWSQRNDQLSRSKNSSTRPVQQEGSKSPALATSQSAQEISQHRSPSSTGGYPSCDGETPEHLLPSPNTPTPNYLQHISALSENIARALTDGLVNFTNLVVPSPYVHSNVLYSTVAKSNICNT